MAEINKVTVGGETYDLRDASAVKSVNGTGPDTSGNVSITLPSVPSAGTTSPNMDGTANAGSAATWSRSDHVHPTDTSRAAASHTHAASQVTAGTFVGKMVAASGAVSTVGTAQLRNIYAGTEDMTAGTTALASGDIYLVYE